MSTCPDLSIITVNRNNRAGLEQTLQSVHEHQCYAGFEHIVVDGASTDGSVDVINAYRNRLANTVSEPDRGIYHAMNKGIAMARGKFLLFLNSGDWLEPDILTLVFNHFPDGDIVYGGLRFVNDGEDGYYWMPPEPAALNFVFWARGSITHGASFIRRTLLEGRGYDESYRIIADREFFFRMRFYHNHRFVRIERHIANFARGGISNDPYYADERRKEVERLFGPLIHPLTLDRLLLDRTPDEQFLDFILRSRQHQSADNDLDLQYMRRWNDLYFLMDRHRWTRVCMRLFFRCVARIEARILRAR